MTFELLVNCHDTLFSWGALGIQQKFVCALIVPKQPQQ